VSLNDILGSALSGLGASQSGLRTISANIANVNTPGYARERVSLSTGVSAGRVSGVVVSEPDRIADRFLEGTVYKRSGELGRAEVTADYLDRLQSMLGAPGAPSGLTARLDAITSAAVALTGSPGSEQALAAFSQQVGDAISTMQDLDRDVAGLRGEVETEVGQTVDTINGLLKRIHELNDTVAQLDGLGRSSAGPADQRMSALEELSKLMNVTVRDQPDGRVTIDTESGAVLLDKRLRQLSYPTAAQGASQPAYQPIEIMFADGPATKTGERIDSAAVGGKLGGLIDLRDRALPQFADQVGVLFGGLAETLNAVANEGTSVPAPAVLEGRQTGLRGNDRLGFTGSATFAVLKANGELVQSAVIDFSTLTDVDAAVAKINSELTGVATASFVSGKLEISAVASGQGIAIAQGPGAPSSRAGVGFSHFFGLNDVVRSRDSALTPSGLIETDPHGFTAPQTAEVVLRDSSGRVLAKHVLTPDAGPLMKNLVDSLNGSDLAKHGTFSLDQSGRFRFEPEAGQVGATLSIPVDTTDRFGTGRSFSSLAGLTGAAAGLSSAEVPATITGSPGRLPLARLNTSATVGQKAIGQGDARGATAFVDRLAKATDFGKGGSSTIESFASNVIGRAAMQASRAEAAMTDASVRQGDAVNRRDSFSGVNIDEELAQLVVFQNSYSAAARVMTTATDMYDTLLNMVG
jgi:flagellar hook-associated protein 1 FlgK